MPLAFLAESVCFLQHPDSRKPGRLTSTTRRDPDQALPASEEPVIVPIMSGNWRKRGRRPPRWGFPPPAHRHSAPPPRQRRPAEGADKSEPRSAADPGDPPEPEPGAVRTPRTPALQSPTGRSSRPSPTPSVPATAASAEAREVAVPVAAFAVTTPWSDATPAPPAAQATPEVPEPSITMAETVAATAFTRAHRTGEAPAPGAEIVAGAMLLTRRTLTAAPVADSVTQISGNPIADFLTDVRVWVETYANLYPGGAAACCPNRSDNSSSAPPRSPTPCR